MRGNLRARLGAVLIATGLLVLAFGARGPSVNAAPVTFSDWTVEGAESAGEWTVSEDGKTVVQEINGAPTFFVSPTNLAQNTFTGTIQVLPDASDGDYFGVVLGYNDPLGAESTACETEDCHQDYVLFDWKHDDQDVAQAGMSLMRINRDDDVRNDDGGDCFWPHTDSPATGCDVLADTFSQNNGWEFGVDYTFKFTYTPTKVKVELLQGQAYTTIFDVNGTFPAGRVGFYNYSQADVRYSGFDAQQVEPTTTTTSTTLASSTTTTTTGASTSTTAAPNTSTTRPATTTSRVLAARTGMDGTATQLLIGVALVAIGALLTVSKGRRPQGSYYS